MIYINCYESPLGSITLASNGIALIGLWFDGQKYFKSIFSKEREEREERHLPIFEKTICWLDLYFGGEIPDFIPLIEMKTTPFRKVVWDILLTIPYGKTVTYGEIAALVAAQKGISHMSARAVGGAVGHNPISLIIPCHRVISANGGLAGYAGGIEKKRQLLVLELANLQKYEEQRK